MWVYEAQSDWRATLAILASCSISSFRDPFLCHPSNEISCLLRCCNWASEKRPSFGCDLYPATCKAWHCDLMRVLFYHEPCLGGVDEVAEARSHSCEDGPPFTCSWTSLSAAQALSVNRAWVVSAAFIWDMSGMFPGHTSTSTKDHLVWYPLPREECHRPLLLFNKHKKQQLV